jgi:hypothetical protein
MATIKVYKLDDYDWWAGESLAACIAEARKQCGAGSYSDAEDEGREITEEGMQILMVDRDDGEKPVTFAQHLADLDGETFPLLFASKDW